MYFTLMGPKNFPCIRHPFELIGSYQTMIVCNKVILYLEYFLRHEIYALDLFYELKYLLWSKHED